LTGKKSENNMLTTQIGGLTLDTPLMTASGTSGSAGEIGLLHNSVNTISALGAFITKGVTMEPRKGNSGIRIAETNGGILNSIGLQNSGAEKFATEELPHLMSYNKPVIVNISASHPEGFAALGVRLLELDKNSLIKGFEINVSCPNISDGGNAFGVQPQTVEKITALCRKNIPAGILLIVKMTPNVTDISEPAKAAIHGGADALSMINTVKGMKIDVSSQRPLLGNISGGLSGPAVRPIGVQAVYRCFSVIPECRNGRVPIIGIGGICNYRDGLEYIFAGATAVGIGTAFFTNLNVFSEIKEGLMSYCAENGTSIPALRGIAVR